MDGQSLVKTATEKFAQSKSHFNDELSKLRTGRAHTSMLDGLMVEAYGVMTPIIQVATLSVPDPATLQITPFDPTTLTAISTAIRSDQQLGLNPADDGRVVRVPVPPLTTERRQQIVKVVKEKLEEANISMRNARHDALKAMKADKDITTDDAKGYQTQLDEALSAARVELESIAKEKETDILKI